MRSHLSNCDNYQAKLKAKAKRPEDIAPNPAKKAKTVQSTLTTVVTIPKENKVTLDELLAKAIFMKGLPFDTLSSPEFDEFFVALNPAYRRPNKEGISLLLCMLWIYFSY